jgi:hypothetical protein
LTSRFAAGLILLLSLALTFSVTSSLKGRQELQTATAANASVRKALGDLTVAITEKDREIARLTESACRAGEKSNARPSPAR